MSTAADKEKLKQFWEEITGKGIEKYTPFQEASHHLSRWGAFFAPGQFYFYVINFFNLHMDFVSGGTKKLLGVEPKDFTIDSLLGSLAQGELELMKKKEAVAADFLFNFLKPEQMPFYKVSYILRVEDAEGQQRTLLHQANAIKVSKTGKIEHVLGIHTDITHLKLPQHNEVSFISLQGDTCYYGINPELGKFEPEHCNSGEAFFSSFTTRELEIIRLLSSGLTATQTAARLCLSEHTVRTHRKKILEKTDCANSTELVAKCLVNGVI